MTSQDPRDQAGGPAREGSGMAGASDQEGGLADRQGAAEPGRHDDRPAWLNGYGSGTAAMAPAGNEPGTAEARPSWWTDITSRPSGQPAGEQANPSSGTWTPDWASSNPPGSSNQPGSGEQTRPLGEQAAMPAWAPPPSDAGTARPAGGVFRWLSLGLAGLLLIAAGVIVGQVFDREQTPASTTGVPSAAAAGPGPVQGSEAEPVAAVAKALTPSVVQLEAEAQGGLGSGVIYDSNGYILTAAHVVDGISGITVRLADGTRLQGRVLGADAASDVGVVKVDRTGLPAATLATGVKLEVGQLAVAIGSPFGLQETVTSGVVSAVNRSLPNEDASTRSVIQTDAAINPGNSGGALADRQGRVIGINSAIRTNAGGGNVGVGFAVPIDLAARVAGQIVKGEPVRQTFLGVSLTNSPNDAGAVVSEVVSDSPAAAAGVRVGDRITKFNNSPVEGSDDLVAQVRAAAPGTTVSLEVVRDGQTVKLTPQLTEKRD